MAPAATPPLPVHGRHPPARVGVGAHARAPPHAKSLSLCDVVSISVGFGCSASARWWNWQTQRVAPAARGFG